VIADRKGPRYESAAWTFMVRETNPCVTVARTFMVRDGFWSIVPGMLSEFREFIRRGNVVDLAVGVIIGAAFGRIVTSLVEGVIMPPLGMIIGKIDFGSLFVVLDKSKGIPASFAEAKAKGIPVIAYGQFINDIITFAIVAFCVFLMVRQVNRIQSVLDKPAPAAAPTTKECPFCISSVSIKATRCPQCTSPI